MSDRKFAYGRNNVGGVSCPVMQAGFDPDSHQFIDIAELYDELVESRLLQMKGVISEEVAQDVWLDLLESSRLNDYESARMVAERLDWVNS